MCEELDNLRVVFSRDIIEIEDMVVREFEVPLTLERIFVQRLSPRTWGLIDGGAGGSKEWARPHSCANGWSVVAWRAAVGNGEVAQYQNRFNMRLRCIIVNTPNDRVRLLRWHCPFCRYSEFAIVRRDDQDIPRISALAGTAIARYWRHPARAMSQARELERIVTMTLETVPPDALTSICTDDFGRTTLRDAFQSDAAIRDRRRDIDHEDILTSRDKRTLILDTLAVIIGVPTIIVGTVGIVMSAIYIPGIAYKVVGAGVSGILSTFGAVCGVKGTICRGCTIADKNIERRHNVNTGLSHELENAENARASNAWGSVMAASRYVVDVQYTPLPGIIAIPTNVSPVLPPPNDGSAGGGGWLRRWFG